MGGGHVHVERGDLHLTTPHPGCKLTNRLTGRLTPPRVFLQKVFEKYDKTTSVDPWSLSPVGRGKCRTTLDGLGGAEGETE